MSGSTFNDVCIGFSAVSATAANSTDVANLADSSSGAQFTGSSALGTLVGSNYTISANQFGTINLTGAKGAANKAHLSLIDYVLNELGTWTSD